MRERFRVEPRDVPAKMARRRLSLTEAEFNALKPHLFARGFPRPDPTTGMYDLKKIDAWMDDRTPFDEPKPIDPADVFHARLARLRIKTRKK